MDEHFHDIFGLQYCFICKSRCLLPLGRGFRPAICFVWGLAHLRVASWSLRMTMAMDDC